MSEVTGLDQKYKVSHKIFSQTRGNSLFRKSEFFDKLSEVFAGC